MRDDVLEMLRAESGDDGLVIHLMQQLNKVNLQSLQRRRMVEEIKLIGHRSDLEYTDVWMCDPPSKSSSYVVEEYAWSRDYSVRVIYRARVVEESCDE